jgi:hypothetical protein
MFCREGFPSWSWLGWSGRLGYFHWLVKDEFASGHLVELSQRRFCWGLYSERPMPVKLEYEASILTPLGSQSLSALSVLRLKPMAAEFRIQRLRDEDAENPL